MAKTAQNRSKTRYPAGAAAQAKRSSRTTSFPEGMEAPVPGLERLSRRDRGKTLPALHAKMELHLLNHAAFTAAEVAQTLPCLRKTWEEMGRLIRPPTPVSAAKTKRARPPSHQLRECGLFLAPRFLQSHAGAPCGSPPRKLKKWGRPKIDEKIGWGKTWISLRGRPKDGKNSI